MSTEYKDIELSDVKRFSIYGDAVSEFPSEYSFTTLWGWSQDCGSKISEDEENGLLWIRRTLPRAAEMAPLGKWEGRDWEGILRGRFGQAAEFCTVPEALMEIWKEQFGSRMTVSGDRGGWEYLYDIKKLAELPGRRYMKKRNRVNRFRRLYRYSYRDISGENIPYVAMFQRDWCLANMCGRVEGLTQENRCIQRVLAHWNEIPGLCGGVVVAEGEIIAYTIGEVLKDILMVHFEKATLSYDAAYQVINQEFAARTAALRPEVAAVNREEDMNDPGLREAKLSYMPSGFVKKFDVSIRL